MLTLIFLIAFPFALWHAWRNLQLAKASPAWPSTEGRVIAATRRKVLWRSQPRVHYSYSVNGASYAGQRIGFSPVAPREVDATLRRYPVGGSVAVHYAPGNPAQAVLEAGSNPQVVAQLRTLVVVFVVLVAVNLALLALRLQQESKKPHYRTYGGVAPADPKLGDRLIRQDAEKGKAQDQFYVGVWYLTGHDVAKDPAEAAKWFRKSADQGYGDAQALLGELYASGNGVDKNIEKGVALFQKAAAQGNVRAYVALGYSYEKGFGVPQDAKQAGDWYRKAKDHPQAEAGLRRLEAAAKH